MTMKTSESRRSVRARVSIIPAHGRRLTLLIVALATVLTAGQAAPAALAAPVVAWALQGQRASDVAVGANGDVWVIGSTPVPGGYSIHRRTSTGAWEIVAGGATRVAVGPDGRPWVVNSYGEVFWRVDGTWRLFRAPRARDIAVAGSSGQGQLWIVSSEPVAGGYAIYHWAGVELQWVRAPGGATRIGAGSSPSPWLVNNEGRVFRAGGPDGWIAVPGTATDVTAGSNEVWIVGTRTVPGGYEIRRFDGVDWVTIAGAGGTAIAAGSDGDPWLANQYTELFEGTLSGLTKRCPIDTVRVPESTSGTYVATLQAGESVTLTPTDATIWAGVWFTGANGPAGWNTVARPGYGYPLAGAREYSLLANKNTGWFYIGAARTTVTNTLGNPQTLHLRTNDNTPGNGSGAFEVNVTYTCRT